MIQLSSADDCQVSVSMRMIFLQLGKLVALCQLVGCVIVYVIGKPHRAIIGCHYLVMIPFTMSAFVVQHKLLIPALMNPVHHTLIVSLHIFWILYIHRVFVEVEPSARG